MLGAALLALVGLRPAARRRSQRRRLVVAAAFHGAALIVTYVTLLRLDPALVPLAVGTMAAVGALGQAAGRAYPGALAAHAGGPGCLVRLVVVPGTAQGAGASAVPKHRPQEDP